MGEKSQKIDGHLFGNDGHDSIAVRVAMETGQNVARVDVAPMTGAGVTIVSVDGRVARFMRRVTEAIVTENHRNRKIVPIPKPAAPKVRRRQTEIEPIRCPTCHGTEPDVWFCDTCQGFGAVKA